MRDTRCPSCENDIANAVIPVLVDCLDDGADTGTVICPHCHGELSLTVTVNTTLTVVDRLAGVY